MWLSPVKGLICVSDNTVTIVGNVTRAPELTFTSGGKPKAEFSVAVNRRYQVNNEWQEQTSFFNVVAWGLSAENAAITLDKGTRVIVSGRLEQRTWEDKNTGQNRSAVEIVADDFGPSLKWATAIVERVERAN